MGAVVMAVFDFVAIMIEIRDISHHAFRWQTVLNEPPSGFGIFSWTFYLFALLYFVFIALRVQLKLVALFVTKCF